MFKILHGVVKMSSTENHCVISELMCETNKEVKAYTVVYKYSQERGEMTFGTNRLYLYLKFRRDVFEGREAMLTRKEYIKKRNNRISNLIMKINTAKEIASKIRLT
jgi:hypothetical protein